MRPVLLALLVCSVTAWLSAASGEPPKPAAVAPATALAPAPASFVGTWEGTDHKGISAAFELGADGYATLRVKGEVMGGHTPGGRSIRYRVDTSRTPIWLDFMAVDDQGAETGGRLLAILELLGPHELRMMINDDPSVRPLGFQDARPDTCITLHRRP